MENKIEKQNFLEPHSAYHKNNLNHIRFELEAVLDKNKNQDIDFIVNNLLLAVEYYGSGNIVFYNDNEWVSHSLWYIDNKYFLNLNDYARFGGKSTEITKEEAIESLKSEIIKINELK